MATSELISDMVETHLREIDSGSIAQLRNQLQRLIDNEEEEPDFIVHLKVRPLFSAIIEKMYAEDLQLTSYNSLASQFSYYSKLGSSCTGFDLDLGQAILDNKPQTAHGKKDKLYDTVYFVAVTMARHRSHKEEYERRLQRSK